MFFAVTVNVYAVPFIKPVIVCVVGVAGKVRGDCAADPMYGVITYAVIAAPPSDDGGAQDTVTWALPGAVVPMLGAPGVVVGAGWAK